MTRVRVLIATTRGPSAVQRIIEEDPVVNSVVCLDGKALPLPISRAYDDFVRDPTGVIERRFGHSSFRVDVDQPIDEGSSWQLGLFVAHALAAHGRLAGKGDACDRIVWCTGEVDHDLSVRGVEHVAEKCDRSKPAFDDARRDGIPVLMIAPKANAAELPHAVAVGGAASAGIERVVVGTVAEACRALGMAIEPAGQREPKGVPWRMPVAALAALLLVIGGWVLLSSRGGADSADLFQRLLNPPASRPAQAKAELPNLPQAPQPVATAPAAPLTPGATMAADGAPLGIALTEFRAIQGAACPQPFAPASLAPRPVALESVGRFAQSRLAGLCGLGFKVATHGVSAHIWSFAQLVPEKVFLLADRKALAEADATTATEAEWLVPIPDGRTKPMRYVFVAMASAQPLADTASMLPRHMDWDGKRAYLDDFKSLSDDLVKRGVTVVIAGQEILP